jgi:signal transduction histidine kinase
MMRLLGSFSFRLALIQSAFFTLAVSLLLGAFYWVSLSRPTVEVEATITTEMHQLEALYRARGLPALARALDQRAAAKARRQAYHVLMDPGGHVITANLPTWPNARSDIWLRLDADVYRDGQEDDHEALSRDIALPGGARLIIGRDVQDLDRVERAIRRALTYVIPPLLLFVILAAAITSRAIAKRIESMSSTARRVMAGELSERVPLRGHNDDFDQLGVTLNAMLDRIEASLESVRRVSDSVAHELRTPLARLQAELAELKAAAPERIPELAERALGEVERLGRMADAVLRISRIEAKRHRTEMRTIDLSALLEDAVDYYAPHAESHGQQIATDIAPDLAVHGDPDLVFQAISNLLDNATKFTPKGGRIALSAVADQGGVLVTIVDSGPGIAPELAEKVGERFFRAPSVALIPGFGLGLAFANAVATLHESALRLSDAAPGLKVEWRLASASS